jgi:iron complex transport system ATP-binding protein
MTLELRDLAIGYRRRRHGDRVVARHLGLDLAPGTFTCLLGPNGAGKSTLIRTITGLQAALSGEVLLDGRPLASYRPRDLARRLSLVLTERAAVGTLPVWSLVAMGRHPFTGWSGRLRRSDETAVGAALEATGMAALAWRPMSELSDGERQKAMIARALAQEPGIMILDEATAHLDLPRRVELMDLLRRLARDRGCAILLSSHDLDLSLRSADRLWLISAGQIREGIPEDLILSGGFAAAFQDDRLAFDPWQGAFQWPRPPRGAVRVAGEGLAALWTRRALERVGFDLAEDADHTVRITAAGDQLLAWSLEDGRQGGTLEALLEALDATPGTEAARAV